MSQPFQQQSSFFISTWLYYL